MKKKYYMIGISCILLLIAGVCYSCSYRADSSAGMLISDLSGKNQQVDSAIPDSNVALSKADSSQTGTKNQDMDNQLLTTNGPNDVRSDIASSSSADQPVNELIYVHLCGSVLKPGVYQVKVGARVIDVIDQAGGLTEEAAGDYVNQAQQVQDGQRIYIPSQDEVKELQMEPYSAVNPSEQLEATSSKQLLNINTADKQELMELPGIGEAKAADIIEYRTTNGSFESIEELMKIPGIKEGLFHKVSSLIAIK